MKHTSIALRELWGQEKRCNNCSCTMQNICDNWDGQQGIVFAKSGHLCTAWKPPSSVGETIVMTPVEPEFREALYKDRHEMYTNFDEPTSDTLMTPQATTAENSHSQNPSNNSVSGTGGDLDDN